MEIFKENSIPGILVEMAMRVGVVKDKQEKQPLYLIYVNTDDARNKPHFHCVDYSTRGQEFHTCIRLDCVEYFLHEGKSDMLTSADVKLMYKFMSSQYTGSKIIHGTNWEYAVSVWNANNSAQNVDEDMEMPNYLEL